MRTITEQLADCDAIERRLVALNDRAVAFVARTYEPKFTLVPADVWGPPHPHDDLPPEWGRVVYASIGAATAITFFAAFVSLIKT